MSDLATRLLEQSRSRLARIRGLVELHEWLSGTPSGQPLTSEDDVLRSSVVFPHATLEDFLRGLAVERLPNSGKSVWDKISRITVDERKPNMTLGDLWTYRGRSVDEFVSKSIERYLGKSSYNHPGDIKNQLLEIGLDSTPLESYRSRLGPMISRRHLIVHRFDQDPSGTEPAHSPQAIDKDEVVGWIEAVESFIMEVLKIAEPEDATEAPT